MDIIKETNGLKKMLDGYKISAKEVLKKLAMANGYKEITIYYDHFYKNFYKNANLQFENNENIVVGPSFVWKEKNDCESKIICVKSIEIQSIRSTQKMTEDDLYLVLLDKILKAVQCGNKIYVALMNNLIISKKIIMNPFEELENILVLADLKDIA